MASNFKQLNKENPTYMTVDELNPIKRAIKQAELEGKETFMYKGSEILVAYAKYLVEYMTLKVKGQ